MPEWVHERALRALTRVRDDAGVPVADVVFDSLLAGVSVGRAGVPTRTLRFAPVGGFELRLVIESLPRPDTRHVTVEAMEFEPDSVRLVPRLLTEAAPMRVGSGIALVSGRAGYFEMLNAGTASFLIEVVSGSRTVPVLRTAWLPI